MDEIRLTTTEALLYVAVMNAAIGFVLGLIPLIVGIVKKKIRTGLIGLFVGTAGGALLGVVASIAAMAIFTWLILRDQIKPTETEPSDVSETDSENN